MGELWMLDELVTQPCIHFTYIGGIMESSKYNQMSLVSLESGVIKAF